MTILMILALAFTIAGLCAAAGVPRLPSAPLLLAIAMLFHLCDHLTSFSTSL